MAKAVYVLTNPAMPGLVKIGYTSHEDANERIAQLYTTGVPVPFEVKFVCKVENAEEVEDALHRAFGPNRINPKREFFQIDPEQAIVILKLLHKEDVTQQVVEQPTDLDVESVAAGESLKARRPNLNFEEMGIPIGSVIQSIVKDVSVTIVAPRKVKFGDAEMSLTAATRIVKGLDYDVAPGPFWAFNGRPLRDIYNETYEYEQG